MIQIAQVGHKTPNNPLLRLILRSPTEVSIPFHELIFPDVRVNGSLLCTRQEAQRMLQDVADHGISVKTNPFFGLDEITKLVDLVHSGKMARKGVIVVGEAEQQRVKEGKAAKI